MPNIVHNTIDLQVACAEKALPTQEQFQLWVDTALSELAENNSQQQAFELTIRLAEVTESQQLNFQYREKDKPTNVLSFPFELPDGIELNLLGDLIICSDIVKKEANVQNKALFDHWAHLVIHGCLHLVGFDHIRDDEAEEMESLEIKILATLGINNPYEEQ
ncbi:rRNA maturation RNase YbeY [Colwellia sp. D2M02]|uniref:rRNA maturation RNase YbeY n=1 Tax=Colwellia sp. D2M02 TaxID=2841562 RepID=UPI001C0A4FAB|nr:rRNA maturation RNase YbeY [Colwellia sp. D2M02]MBU2893993.1 rRNA maturation RNase YbeY [Colwellia sp. D2M02]